MKTHHLKFVTPAFLTALAFCAGGVAAHAQNPAGMSLEVASPQSEAFTLKNLSGKPVRASNQEQLSTVSDFLIEPQSGRVQFLVAPSGGGAEGDTFRIIPIAAITASPSGDTFNLTIDRSQWEKVGTMTESRLRGKISINEEHQQRLAREMAMSGQPASTGALEFVRASELRGREIRAGNEQVGTIEDVVIDLHNKIAAPLVTPAGGFAAGAQKFLVPFQQLQLGDQAQGAINTTLTRADFQRLQPGLSPTGQPSSWFGQPQSAAASATAVQTALARNPSLAKYAVQVVPESRLVLRGTVENEQRKQEVQQAAQQAAPGVRIDNEITVQNR